MVTHSESNKVKGKKISPPLGKEEMVTVIIPIAFIHRPDHNSSFRYEIGIQEIPKSHAEHPFAKACGVKLYSPCIP